jgi:hypothetical protein
MPSTNSCCSTRAFPTGAGKRSMTVYEQVRLWKRRLEQARGFTIRLNRTLIHTTGKIKVLSKNAGVFVRATIDEGIATLRNCTLDRSNFMAKDVKLGFKAPSPLGGEKIIQVALVEALRGKM